VGFEVDKVALGQVFSEQFCFPRQFSFYQMLDIHFSFKAGSLGQLVMNVPSGLSLTPPHPTKFQFQFHFLFFLLVKLLT
jgi:hypothetical protein